MLDPYIKPFIYPTINTIGQYLTSYKISANMITIAGLGIGVIGIFLVAQQQYYIAIPLILLNRFCDGLDGAIARHTKISDFGGTLDITCDFIFYAGLIFSFGFANPSHLLHAHFLLFSFMGQAFSFLTYAILAAKNNKHTTQLGIKSFYYIRGICEGTESISLFISMCLFHTYFIPISMVYALLCWITTIGRIYVAWQDFS